jgi:hypothetical protein
VNLPEQGSYGVGDQNNPHRWRGGKAEQFIELSKCESVSDPDKRSCAEDNFRSYSGNH